MGDRIAYYNDWADDDPNAVYHGVGRFKMANEMIEKVAKAIRDSFNSNDVDCYPIAKAAIAAMREPTEEMIDAGAYDLNMKLQQQWQAMIDAALKE